MSWLQGRGPQTMPVGRGPLIPWGAQPMAAQQLGRSVNDFAQPCRLEVAPPKPATHIQAAGRVFRHSDPRIVAPGRGAEQFGPATPRPAVLGEFNHRPTCAPAYAQQGRAIGGRHVAF